jgi:thiamine transport system substrate-binding protein
VLLTHSSFALSDTVIAQFQEQSHLTLRVLTAGDAGAMVNQAILSKSHPLGDVLFGVDNTFLSRALNADVFEPYSSPALARVPAEFRLDAQDRVTPVDYGDVCLNLDKQAFAGATPAPTTLEDLAKPAYKGQLVVENPATSSPGLAFMLATIAKFGESGNPGWLDYWAQLRANDVQVSPSWSDAYETQFSAGPGKGPRPIVVSYASSPPAEVYYSSPPISEPPSTVMLDGCFRQVEFAGVLAGAANPEGARAFIDFLLSPAAQADMPLQMFVFPAVTSTPLPDVFRQFAVVPPQPLSLDPAAIEQKRDRWIDEWTKVVLR